MDLLTQFQALISELQSLSDAVSSLQAESDAKDAQIADLKKQIADGGGSTPVDPGQPTEDTTPFTQADIDAAVAEVQAKLDAETQLEAADQATIAAKQAVLDQIQALLTPPAPAPVDPTPAPVDNGGGDVPAPVDGGDVVSKKR